MKALFVIHESSFIYGSNRSIMGLLKNLDYDYDLMICRSFTRKIDSVSLKKDLGQHLQQIHEVWLPRYRCQYYDRVSMVSEISHIVNNIMAWLGSGKRKKLISAGKYDYVHLNSLVLFPVVDKNARYIMHVREIINPRYHLLHGLIRALKQTAGLIYIDEATKMPLEHYIGRHKSLTLNNPFDMTHVRNIAPEACLNEYGLSGQNVIFSMLGQVGDNKGSKFVLRAFMGQNDPNSRLLIAGNNNHAYGRECREMARHDCRIIFCGELQDTAPIYRISDYIIRGDAQFCIGRTIYEGLFAGIGVIIPGQTENLKQMQFGEELRDKICFYQPGDLQNLTNVISSCAVHKQNDREYRSNQAEYMEQYNKFINEIMTE